MGNAQNRIHVPGQRMPRRTRMESARPVDRLQVGRTVPVQGLRGGYYQAPNFWHRIIRGELITSLMSNEEVRAYLARIGSKGGKASRRTLTSAQAKAMVKAREKKRRATKRALRRSNS